MWKKGPARTKDKEIIPHTLFWMQNRELDSLFESSCSIKIWSLYGSFYSNYLYLLAVQSKTNYKICQGCENWSYFGKYVTVRPSQATCVCLPLWRAELFVLQEKKIFKRCYPFWEYFLDVLKDWVGLLNEQQNRETLLKNCILPEQNAVG